MSTTTAAGSTLYIGTTVAASDQSGWEADTFTVIGEITNAGEFGREYNAIKVKSLSQRKETTKKGSFSLGTLSPELNLDTDDAGQQACETARDTDDEYNFKLTLNDAPAGSPSQPTTYYFRGPLMKFRTMVGDVDSVVKASMTAEINDFLKVDKVS